MLDLADDLNMMQNPSRWPSKTVLPLKHRYKTNKRGWPEFAVIVNGYGPKLFHTTFGDPFDENTPTTQYESFEDIIKDGWIVD